MMIVAVVRGLMMKHIGSGSADAHIRVDLGLMRVQQNVVAVAAERETGRLLRGGGRSGRRRQLLMRLERSERHRGVVALVFAHRVEVAVALLVHCEQCSLALCAVLCDECCLVAEDVVAAFAEVHRTNRVTDVAMVKSLIIY